jgi:dTDP-glucose 4,6-dehydratase/UDP-glucose 4-epimerase
MAKILVIGCKGFIGTHVFNFFVSNPNYECWGGGLSVDYVTENYIQIDPLNNDFNDLFENNNFDYCINCSGAASVPASFQNPIRDFNLNTSNVMRMLDSIRKHNPICKFINLSSAAVYGNPTKLPISENDSCNPLSPYGNNKLFAEKTCEIFYKYFGLKTCSLRIFSAYGPGLKKQLLWDIYKKTISEKDILLFGTGNETRDYVYIDDIVKAIEIIMLNGNFEAGIYNIANGISTSISEVSNSLLNELEFKGNLKFTGSERPGDPINWKADISKLKALGYEPEFDISSGLKKTVQWLKELKY